MKTAETIISHLLHQPTFRYLKKVQCLNLFITQALPPTLSRFISFCYIKNDTLFIAINHHGIKMELYYKAKLLKSILVMFKKTNPKCEMINFSDIKIFVTNKEEKKVDETIPRYYEHSKAEFENFADGELAKQFEAIRQEIQSLMDNDK